MPDQKVRGVACKFRTLFPEIRLRKEDGREGVFTEKPQEETGLRKGFVYSQKGGDPELDDMLMERARGGPGWRRRRQTDET